jgi:hypothetical protein
MAPFTASCKTPETLISSQALSSNIPCSCCRPNQSTSRYQTHAEDAHGKDHHPRKQHTELTSRQPASPTACSRRQTRGRRLIVFARPMAGAFTLCWEPGHQETTNITPAHLSPSDHPTAKVGSFVHSNIRIRTFPGKPARCVEN